MAQNALRDENRIPVMLFVGSDGGTYYVKGDEITGRLYVDLNIDAGDVKGPASSVNENIAVFDGITGKIIKDGAKKISELQLALGYTAENVSNKSTNVATDGSSDTKYPSVKAVKDYADGLVVGLWDDRGSYDASGNVYPSTGGSGTAGAILKGDIWTVSVAGTLGGVSVEVGDTVRAITDTPGQTSSNWSVLENNIGYVPENVANKKTSMTGNTTSDTFYLTAKAIYDWATGLFQTLGNLRTSFQTTPDDTHYPSEKLVKDSLDLKAPLASPTFTGTVTLPKTLEIQDTSADHQYVLAVNELTADRTVTLPLLTGNDEFAFKDHTQTFTNKRITPRVTAITSHATPTINTDNCDAVTITAQAEAITSMTTNLSGTPTNFQKLIIRIKDNGTAIAITWGDSFEAKGVALPTTTVISKVLTVGFIYDTVTSKWGCVAVAQEA